MVCLGNICRSPMAEGLMRDLAAEVNFHVEIDSAGTGNYHIGEAPDNRAVDTMRAHGHDITALRARQFSKSDFAAFDVIFVMDHSNLQNVLKLASSDEERGKVKMFLTAPDMPKQHREVPDPYFGGAQGFEDVYHLIALACRNWLMLWKNERL